MKAILCNIAILIGLIIFGNLLLLIPDYTNGTWVDFGAAGGDIFIVLLGLIPIIVFILLDLSIINVYSLPLSDLLDEGIKYVMYILVFVVSIVCSSFNSSLNNALSLILAVFVMLFPLYVFYDNIVRSKLRVQNKFVSEYLPAVVFGGVILLSIGLSYLLALFNVYLPGDFFLWLGEETVLDLVQIPTLYLFSLGGLLLYFLYWIVADKILPKFAPKTEYKYATYGTEYKTCKNCQFYKGNRCELGLTNRTWTENGIICYDYKRKN